MITNFMDIVKSIKEPLDRKIPKDLKGKVRFRVVKAGTQTILFRKKRIIEIEPDGNFDVINSINILLPFKGLNSKIAYVNLEGNNLQQIRQEIINDMDAKETTLVLNAIKVFGKQKVIMIRRRISPDIIKIMGMNKRAQRALIVNPTPVTKKGEKSGKFYYAVYGYESIILMLVDKKGGK